MSELMIYTDGGSRGNPGQSAYAFVVYDDRGKKLLSEAATIGMATNNIAEYTAILKAMHWLSQNISQSIRKVYFHIDSELAVRQLKGEYKVKNKNLIPLVSHIKSIQKSLSCTVFFSHVVREKNSLADFLVNKALDKNSQT